MRDLKERKGGVLATYLMMDSATFFPSNLLIVSLSGTGSTEHDWIATTTCQGNATVHTSL